MRIWAEGVSAVVLVVVFAVCMSACNSSDAPCEVTFPDLVSELERGEAREIVTCDAEGDIREYRLERSEAGSSGQCAGETHIQSRGPASTLNDIVEQAERVGVTLARGACD